MLAKLRSVFLEFGPVAGIIYATHRMLSRVGGACYLYHFLAQPVATQPLVPDRLRRSIEVRQIDLGDFTILSQLPLTTEVVIYRKRQNATCLCALKQDQVLGCIWLCIGPYEEDEVRCLMVPVPSGQVSWDFDLYLHPAHRLGLGFASLWDGANGYLRDHGVQWSVSRVSCWNKPSLAAHARLNAQRVGSALFVRLGNMQFMLSSLRPFAHLSRSSRKVPKLTLAVPMKGN